MQRQTRVKVTAVALGLTLVLVLAAGLLQGPTPRGDAGSTDDTVSTSIAPTARHSDLPGIGVQELPREALETIALVSRNGPYPYEQDGSVFGNREGLLPPEPQGYYLEYTVPTPGSPDRGARRIIVGASGEVYFTDDHYQSFSEVLGNG